MEGKSVGHTFNTTAPARSPIVKLHGLRHVASAVGSEDKLPEIGLAAVGSGELRSTRHPILKTSYAVTVCHAAETNGQALALQRHAGIGGKNQTWQHTYGRRQNQPHDMAKRVHLHHIT
jgi:hypothetical protein